MANDEIEGPYEGELLPDPERDPGLPTGVPQESWRDRLRKLVIGASGEVPGVGFLVNPILEMAWKSSYDEQMEDFFQRLLTTALKHESRIGNLEERLQSGVVASLGILAARQAGTASSEEKRAYLANALLHIIMDDSWDDRADLAEILIRLVGELTATHIRLLDLLADPTAWQNKHVVDLESQLGADANGRWAYFDLIALAFPSLDQATMIAALTDLESRRLLDAIDIARPDSSASSREKLMEGVSSELGRTLLDFIAGV